MSLACGSLIFKILLQNKMISLKIFLQEVVTFVHQQAEKIEQQSIAIRELTSTVERQSGFIQQLRNENTVHLCLRFHC